MILVLGTPSGYCFVILPQAGCIDCGTSQFWSAEVKEVYQGVVPSSLCLVAVEAVEEWSLG